MPASKLKPALLALTLGLGAAGLLLAVHLQYPIGDWLIWRYLAYFLACGVWAVACLGFGARLLDSFCITSFAADQRWVLGFALGVFAFGMAMLVLGLLGLWSGWIFPLLPLVFLGLGRRELRGATSALKCATFPNAVTAIGVVGAGVVGILLVYLPILSPGNLGYDARWYHLALAEQYAVRGGIEAFREGWLLGAYPQLASVIYGWAFLLPVGALFDRIELSLHLEFTIFVATLASVPVLARALIGERQPYAWVFMLLFPGLYLYDSNLIGGADHVAAFWAVPIALAGFRAWNDFTARPVLLTTLFASAALLTKYTAAGLVLGPGLLLLGRAAHLLFKASSADGVRRRTIVALGVGTAAGLLVTSPHWLKNYLFYGDPLLPFLRELFPPHPWVPGAEDRLTVFADPGWKAKHSVRDVLNTLASPFTFAFWPHNWSAFHERVPVFGFLYTLTMPAIFFVPKRSRIAALYVVVSIGVIFWYWTFHQDRYLQAYLPWMAACVAAVVTQAWRLGAGVRFALVLLIAAQLVAGAGVPFLPTHPMLRQSPYSTSIKLIGGWLSEKRVHVESPLGAFSQLPFELPEDAKVLVHDEHLTLGIGRPIVSDALAWQTGIDYGTHSRPSEIWSLLRSFELSHVVWKVEGGYGLSSIGADVAFYYFVLNHLDSMESLEGLRIGTIPSNPPSDEAFLGRVALLGCETSYENGIYPIEALTATWLGGAPDKSAMPAPETPIKSKPGAKELIDLLAGVDAVRIDGKCMRKVRIDRQEFTEAHKRGTLSLYIRALKRE